jgi:hypothetical protein
MLSYNVIRAFMATAAGVEGARPREISFKGTQQAISAFRDALQTADPERRTQLWAAMLGAIAYDRVGDRPGRVEPRCKKRRPKCYKMLTCTREEARKQLQRAA